MIVDSTAREIAMVLVLAMLGLGLAAAAVFAPWDMAEASVVVDLHSPR